MITIPEFYNNRDVFITGATGFVGKVLIEKLLRSCSGIKRVFLLLRSKRSKSINERLEEIKNTAVSESQKFLSSRVHVKSLELVFCLAFVPADFPPEFFPLLSIKS